MGCDPDLLFSSVPQLCPTLCNPMDCSMPSFSLLHSRNLLKLMPIESVMPSNHLILCCPLLPPPSIFPSIRGLVSQFFASGSPSTEYSGLISFRIDWFDLLAVQGALKCLLQHHTSSAYACKLVHTGEERGWRKRRLGSFSLLCFALTSVLMRWVSRPLVKRLQGD